MLLSHAKVNFTAFTISYCYKNKNGTIMSSIYMFHNKGSLYRFGVVWFLCVVEL